MNSKIEQLEKRRRRLRQNKQISFVVKLMILFAAFFIYFKYVAPTEITSFLFIGLLILLYFIFAFTTVFSFWYPYDDLKEEYNKELLKNFLDEYHPNVKWNFNHRLNLWRTLFRNEYEDFKVKHIETYDLQQKNVKVTSSRIYLKHKSIDNLIKNYQVLHFKLKGKNYPKTVFNKNKELGLLNKFTEKHNYSNFKEVPDSKLLYATEDLYKFEKEIQPILSLLSHLSLKVKTFYVKMEGDQIFMIFDKPIFTLDAHTTNIKDTFLDKKYAEDLGKKINTLLILADSFDNQLEKTETEERLELKMLDIIEDKKSNFKT